MCASSEKRIKVRASNRRNWDNTRWSLQPRPSLTASNQGKQTRLLKSTWVQLWAQVVRQVHCSEVGPISKQKHRLVSQDKVWWCQRDQTTQKPLGRSIVTRWSWKVSSVSQSLDSQGVWSGKSMQALQLQLETSTFTAEPWADVGLLG